MQIQYICGYISIGEAASISFSFLLETSQGSLPVCHYLSLMHALELRQCAMLGS